MRGSATAGEPLDGAGEAVTVPVGSSQRATLSQLPKRGRGSAIAAVPLPPLTCILPVTVGAGSSHFPTPISPGRPLKLPAPSAVCARPTASASRGSATFAAPLLGPPTTARAGSAH